MFRRPMMILFAFWIFKIFKTSRGDKSSCLLGCLIACLSACLLVSLLICLFAYLPIFLFACLPVCLFTSLSIFLFCLFVVLFVHLFICCFICSFVYLFGGSGSSECVHCIIIYKMRRGMGGTGVVGLNTLILCVRI